MPRNLDDIIEIFYGIWYNIIDHKMIYITLFIFSMGGVYGSYTYFPEYFRFENQDQQQEQSGTGELAQNYNTQDGVSPGNIENTDSSNIIPEGDTSNDIPNTQNITPEINTLVSSGNSNQGDNLQNTPNSGDQNTSQNINPASINQNYQEENQNSESVNKTPSITPLVTSDQPNTSEVNIPQDTSNNTLIPTQNNTTVSTPITNTQITNPGTIQNQNTQNNQPIGNTNNPETVDSTSSTSTSSTSTSGGTTSTSSGGDTSTSSTSTSSTSTSGGTTSTSSGGDTSTSSTSSSSGGGEEPGEPIDDSGNNNGTTSGNTGADGQPVETVVDEYSKNEVVFDTGGGDFVPIKVVSVHSRSPIKPIPGTCPSGYSQFGINSNIFSNTTVFLPYNQNGNNMSLTNEVINKNGNIYYFKTYNVNGVKIGGVIYQINSPGIEYHWTFTICLQD